MPSTRDAAPGRRLPSEDAAAAMRVRIPPLLIDKLCKGWAGRVAFQPARLVVEALQCSKLFLAAEPGFRHRGFQHADRLVVYRDRHRKGVTVLPAMGERKPSRV